MTESKDRVPRTYLADVEIDKQWYPAAITERHDAAPETDIWYDVAVMMPREIKAADDAAPVRVSTQARTWTQQTHKIAPVATKTHAAQWKSPALSELVERLTPCPEALASCEAVAPWTSFLALADHCLYNDAVLTELFARHRIDGLRTPLVVGDRERTMWHRMTLAVQSHGYKTRWTRRWVRCRDGRVSLEV